MRLNSIIAVTLAFVALLWVNGTSANEHGQWGKVQKPKGLAKAAAVPSGPSLVSVNGRQLMVSRRNPDGTLASPGPYVIRGVVWSPASQNTASTLTSRRPEFGIWANTDIPLMKAMNINTVYMFFDPGLDATGTSVLDQLYSNGIMVVMTVDEDGSYNLTRLQQTVNFYKDHPAILAWLVGNEWNVNLYKGAASTVLDAANKTESAAQLIKSLDTNHPVATSYADIEINDAGRHLADTQRYVNDICSSVDLWGLNIYRSNTFSALFEQWKAISGKPIFLGEFGTDVFRSTNSSTHDCEPGVLIKPKPGSEDGLMQAHWETSEWNAIYRNLSANNPARVSVGGFIFEWNDEWWKIPTDDCHPQHSTDGCDDTKCGGHPDHFGNEEYFGIVDINRQPRPAYDSLKAAFAPGYQPAQRMTYRAVSRGGSVTGEYPSQLGLVIFLRDGEIFYRRDGGDAGALARGFNVAVIDPCTNKLPQLIPVQHFDTYHATHPGGPEMTQMIDFLESLPPGVLVMISVADEAGLNQNDSCAHLGNPVPLFEKLEEFGSTKIRSYCFRDSWSMVAVKGEGVARAEQLGKAIEVSAQTTLPIAISINPNGQSFPKNGGQGNVQVIAPGVCSWTGDPIDSWITINSGGNGVGNGTLNYSVSLNPNGEFRTGTITIASQLFNVVQSAANNTLRIDSVIPQAGRTSGGQQIGLTGAFAGLATVTMGGVSASWSYTNGGGDTSAITVTSPAHAVGAVQIHLTPVSGAGYAGYSKPNAFAYLPTVFTDDVLVISGTIAKAQHIIELRQAVDALRAVAGLTPAPWIDSALAPASDVIRAIHIQELRTYLDDAASRLGYATSPYTDPSLTTGFLIKRVHIEELRQRVRTIAG